MKKHATVFIAALATMAVLGLAVIPAPAAASNHDSWQVIKNAVREEARPEAVRGEARWFKIIITDRHSREENLKLTIPLSLVEGLVQMASAGRGRHCHKFNFDSDFDFDVDIDFAEVLAQLKKAGPLSLLEIRDDDSLIKIWIE